MFGVGDALVGAGTPFASTAVGWLASSERLINCASFLAISEGESEGPRETDRRAVGSSAVWISVDEPLVLLEAILAKGQLERRMCDGCQCPQCRRM
jgi:hypothetical protein